MIVKELIEQLKKCKNQEAQVVLWEYTVDADKFRLISVACTPDGHSNYYKLSINEYVTSASIKKAVYENRKI